MTGGLFEPTPPVEPWPERLGPGAMLHHGFAVAVAPALAVELARLTGPVAPEGDPERSSDVGGDDEWWRAGVGVGSDRLPL